MKRIALHRSAVLLALSTGLLTVAGPTFAQFIYNPANGHHYESVSVEGGLTWNQARVAAMKRTYQRVAGHLVCPTTPEETRFLVENVALNDYWLGAYQDPRVPDYKEPAGGWRWITGERWSYTNWNKGIVQEPNDAGSSSNYTHFWSGNPGHWNDSADADKRGYVVEYPTTGRAANVPGATATATSSNQSAGDLLRRVHQKYQSFSSYAETIETRVLVDVYNEEVERARAEFTWQRPNRFRLVGTGLEGKVTAVGDGRNLFLIDRAEPDTYVLRPMPTLTQALGEGLRIMSDAFAAPVTLGLLSDPAPTIASTPWLQTAKLGEVIEGAKPAQTIIADVRIRYDNEPGIKATLKLVISKDDLLVQSSELRFRYETYPLIIRQTHSNIEINPRVEADQFSYQIPRAAERVRRLRNAAEPEPDPVRP